MRLHTLALVLTLLPSIAMAFAGDDGDPDNGGDGGEIGPGCCAVRPGPYSDLTWIRKFTLGTAYFTNPAATRDVAIGYLYDPSLFQTDEDRKKLYELAQKGELGWASNDATKWIVRSFKHTSTDPTEFWTDFSDVAKKRYYLVAPTPKLIAKAPAGTIVTDPSFGWPSNQK